MRPNDDCVGFKIFMIGIIALLILSACAPDRPQDALKGFDSPEDMIMRIYSIPPMSNPVILSKRSLGVGRLYLFTHQSTYKDGHTEESFGLQLFIRNPTGTGWSDYCSVGYARSDTPPRGSLLDYEISTCRTHDDSFVVVFGKALDPRVEHVKLGYNQGEYLAVVDNDVFGEVVPKQVKLCSLSILSKDDQVLERIDLTKDNSGLTDPVYARPEDCPSE